MASPVAIRPTDVLVPVQVAPGGSISLQGSWHVASHDFVIDPCQSGRSNAATPSGQGAFDYAGGGWQLQSRDWKNHTCMLVSTGEPAQVCAAAGVASPCLPSRLRFVAAQPELLMSSEEIIGELKGSMTMQVIEAVAAPLPQTAAVMVPAQSFLSQYAAPMVGGGLLTLVLGFFAFRSASRRKQSPEEQVRKMARTVRGRLERAEPVYRQLIPQVDALGEQAGTLAKLRDQFRARVTRANRPEIEKRLADLTSRAEKGGQEAAEARTHVANQLEQVTRWEAEGSRAADRIDRALEFLRALEARLIDELENTTGQRTGVRAEEDSRLLKELERDVSSALEGAREAEKVVSAALSRS